MTSALVNLYLASDMRLACMQKEVDFAGLPRTGEWLKVRNEKTGEFFPFEIMEVTHREGAIPEIVLGLLKKNDKEYKHFNDNQELEEYIQSFTSEGWKQVSLGENREYKNF